MQPARPQCGGPQAFAWLARARWWGAGLLATVAVATVVVTSSTGRSVGAPAMLLLTSLGLAVTGVASRACLRGAWPTSGFERCTRGVLLVDSIALAVLVHCTGGVSSPFLVALAGLPLLHHALLPRSAAVWATGSAVVVLGLLAWLGGLDGASKAAWLPSWPGLHGVVALVGGGALLHAWSSVGAVWRQEDVLAMAPRELVQRFSSRLARRVREPLGIARARAELIRLGARPATERGDDLHLLVESLDEVSRELRAVFAFLPPSRIAVPVELADVVDEGLARAGMTRAVQRRLAGRVVVHAVSRSELLLACELSCRVVEMLAVADAPVRVDMAQDGAEAATLSIAFQPSGRWRWADLRAGRSAAGERAPAVRLAVIERIVENHAGRLTLSRTPHEARVVVRLPTAPPDRRGEEPRPDRTLRPAGE